MHIKIIPRCSCGEPVNDGYTLCPQCVAEVNRKAMTVMETMIEKLGLGKHD